MWAWPKTDLDYIQGNGKVVGEILKQGHPRSTLFTGSQKVAEQLALDLKGKVCTLSSLLSRACMHKRIWMKTLNLIS